MRLFNLAVSIGLTFTCLSSALAHQVVDDRQIMDLAFEDLMQVQIKAASRISDSVKDAPVPVTIISKEMIAQSGAQTVKELLWLYVPGMVPVEDQNESNIAMRGIYSSSQQKILFLLNGHRLNSRSYSNAAPDHSIALDKLKQIEIIRGPGSSVYGSVALTAVVNLVLKQPEDTATVKLSMGNYGQQSIYADYGQSNWLAWLYHYQNDGEQVSVAPTDDYARVPDAADQTAIIGGFNDNPSLDLGFRYDDGAIHGLVNWRRSHYMAPFSDAQLTGEAIDYDDYQQVHGIGPGVELEWLHLGLGWNWLQSETSQLKQRIFYDKSSTSDTLTLNPSIQLFAFADWHDYDYGFETQFNHSFNPDNSIAVGVQYDKVKVTASSMTIGTGGELSTVVFDSENPLLRPGSETTQALFAEYSYQGSKRWLFNLGFRYDDKDRLTTENRSAFSPRLAAIYNNADSNFNLKMSYARSFVDPPYWNRYSALPSFRGSVDLDPELLTSWQINPTWVVDIAGASLQYSANFFYNQTDKAVFRDNQAGPDEPIYTNAGELDLWGIEQELTYTNKAHEIHWISSYSRVSSSEKYAARDDDLFNIPHITSNFQWHYDISSNWQSTLNIKYLGSRRSPIDISFNGSSIEDPFPEQGVSYFNADFTLPAVTLVDFVISAENLLLAGSRFSIEVNNLLNKDWQQGGSTIHPYPQQGRWWRLSYQQAF